MVMVASVDVDVVIVVVVVARRGRTAAERLGRLVVFDVERVEMLAVVVRAQLALRMRGSLGNTSERRRRERQRASETAVTCSVDSIGCARCKVEQLDV